MGNARLRWLCSAGADNPSVAFGDSSLYTREPLKKAGLFASPA